MADTTDRKRDRNKTPLVGWHPPAELVEWLNGEAAKRGGRGARSAILTEALNLLAYRETLFPPHPDIYLVITQDRHTGVDVQPFGDQAEAEVYADQMVAASARHPEDITDDDRVVTPAMASDDWVWYCRYSVEGDSVRVVRRPLLGGKTEVSDDVRHG